MGKFKTNVHKDGVIRQIDNSCLQEYLDTGWIIGRGLDVWNKGLTIDDDRVEKYASKMRGKHLSEEQKKHLSEVNIGKKWTKEALEKRSVSRRGKKLSAEVKNKISNSLRGHIVTEKTRLKISQRNKGKSHSQTEEQKRKTSIRNSSPEFQKYQRDLKIKNGTINTSKPEQRSEQKLVEIFGNTDVIFNYSESRYPFECDAYIKSLDLFIEFNYHWTHGKHPFNETCLEDLNEVKRLKSKNQTRINSKGQKVKSFYAVVLEVWTMRDVKKLQCAKNNQLNYLMFYTEQEFLVWFEGTATRWGTKAIDKIEGGKK